MTVWAFGDSFAQYADGEHEQWIQQVATGLNTSSIGYGLNGSSLEYTYTKFNEIREQIKENDTILVILTGLTRKWFFKDMPWHNSDQGPHNDDETTAIELYRNHLTNLDLTYTNLVNFLYNVNAISKKLNLNTVMLVNFLDIEEFLKDKKQQFPYIHFAEGKMVDVSVDDIDPSYFRKQENLEKFGAEDLRLNHLTKTNHTVLANKILDHIKSKNPVNLKQGFVKGVLNENNMNDPDFVKNELFDIVVEKIYKKYS